MLINSCLVVSVSIFALANGNTVNIWMMSLPLSPETRVQLSAGRQAAPLSD